MKKSELRQLIREEILKEGIFNRKKSKLTKKYSSITIYDWYEKNRNEKNYNALGYIGTGYEKNFNTRSKYNNLRELLNGGKLKIENSNIKYHINIIFTDPTKENDVVIDNVYGGYLDWLLMKDISDITHMIAKNWDKYINNTKNLKQEIEKRAIKEFKNRNRRSPISRI